MLEQYLFLIATVYWIDWPVNQFLKVLWKMGSTSLHHYCTAMIFKLVLVLCVGPVSMSL
jgi:hypothetical protein